MTELIGMERKKLDLIHAALHKEIAQKFRVMEVPEFKEIVLKSIREVTGESGTTISDNTARRYMKEMNVMTERQYKRMIRDKISEMANLSVEEICQKYDLSIKEDDDEKEPKEKKKDDSLTVKEEEEKTAPSSNRKRKRDSEDS